MGCILELDLLRWLFHFAAISERRGPASRRLLQMAPARRQPRSWGRFVLDSGKARPLFWAGTFAAFVFKFARRSL
jgi:hypothetical protein